MSKRKQIMRRLRSRAGESLTEVLVALMVSALGLMLLAAMISSSSNLVIKSKDKVSAYGAAEVSMIEKSGESMGTYSVSFVKKGNDGVSSSLPLTTSWSGGTSSVPVYSNSVQFGNATVTLY